MSFDAYQMVTDRICQLMEQGFIPWNMPWAMKKNVRVERTGRTHLFPVESVHAC